MIKICFVVVVLCCCVRCSNHNHHLTPCSYDHLLPFTIVANGFSVAILFHSNNGCGILFRPCRTAVVQSFLCATSSSLNVKHPRSTYIGFTVHPKRRIRQHNGEISGGAFRTRKKRPWDMGCVVQGFPNKVSALQFEYAWTNPNRSRLLKGFVGKTKKYGFNNKMELLAILLSVEPFANYGLSVHCQHADVLSIWNNIIDSSRTKKA